MRGTCSTRRRAMCVAIAWLALLVVSACNEANPFRPSYSTNTTPVRQYLGEYTVRITAAPSCSLPDYATTRTSTGRLTQSGQDLVVAFDPYDSQYATRVGSPGFTGTREGEKVHFVLNGDSRSSGYSFAYLVNDMEVGYTGTATGTMADNGSVATFNGTVALYRYTDHTLVAACEATDHAFELLRK